MKSLSNISIRILKVSDVTQSYVDWFSNDEVIKFSNNQYGNFSMETQLNMLKIALKIKILIYMVFLTHLHILEIF